MDAILHPDCIGGFDLTQSTCINGVLANRKAGEPNWSTVNGLQPAFVTHNGIEGVQFANNAGQAIVGGFRGQWQATAIITARVESNATMALFGGTYAANNTYGSLVSGYKFKTQSALSASYGSVFAANTPHVFVSTWSPTTGKTYSQVGTNAPVIATSASDKKYFARIAYPFAGIGVHRTTYFTGWITRVSFFSKPLYETDAAGLAAMIAYEMARVGI